MRLIGRPCLLWVVGVVALLLGFGCKGHPSASAAKVGMTGDEVRAVFGNPLITGRINNAIPGQEKHEERWTYRLGRDALVLLIDDGKVSKVDTLPSTVDSYKAKVRVGMSMQEVLTAAGTPAGGYSDKDPNPNQHWTYGDMVAPVQTFNVDFKDGKVEKAAVVDNDAYITGGDGQPQ